MRALVVCGLLASVSGCYLSHGRAPGDGASMRDAGPSHDAFRADAPIVRRDAGPPPDAPPLPDDEPDVMPGERPSDDPGADDWIDPPAGSTDPCCDVGEIVGIGDPIRQGASPVVAWDGAEWGTAWSDLPGADGTGDPIRAMFRRLDATAHPSSDLVLVSTMLPWLSAMAYGNHRFGIATSGDVGFRATGDGRLAVVDRDGAIRSSVTLPRGLEGRAIARFALVHGWAVVATTQSEGEDGAATLFAYDEALDVVAERDLGRIGHGGFEADPGIAAVKSRLVVATSTSALRTTVRTFAESTVDLVDETSITNLGSELAAATFRDTAILVGRTSSHGGPVRAAVWDPFDPRVVAPQTIATATGDQGLGLAAEDIGGTIGVCFPSDGTATTNSPTIEFVLLGPDGAAIGAPVTIGTGFSYVAACAVGAADRDTYVVLFWDAEADPMRYSILAARVTVRR